MCIYIYMCVCISMYVYIYICIFYIIYIYIYSENTVEQAYNACDAAVGGPEFHAAHRTKKNVARREARLVGGPCPRMEL